MKNSVPLLSICVVLYRAEDVVARFHSELLSSLELLLGSVELLYYDNSPTDTLRNTLTGSGSGVNVEYIHDPSNLGFAYANNRLILAARSDRILLLNPDVFGFHTEIWSAVLDRDVTNSAWFARLLNADGSFQDCVGEPASLRRIFSKQRVYGKVTEPEEVGCGIMAFTLTSRSVFARVGLLDCGFPLYAEDMDWCVRAKAAGVAVYFDPRIELTHLGGQSAEDRWKRVESLRRKYAAERIYIDKHYRGAPWALMRIANSCKMVLRVR
jgi:GT2 family glycosyltransferase